MRVLILGGTTEASALVHALAGDARFEITLSLAGRTSNPVVGTGVSIRSGGFGGAEGLARWLRENSVDAVVDATHPFAAHISANAVAATGALALPLCVILRAPWSPAPGDNWLRVATIENAADALSATRRKVFLSVGRQSVSTFRRAPQHDYVIRTIEMPDDDGLPPYMTLIQARGPFALADEIDLLLEHRIDLLVTKNSGGDATYAKIEAARQLSIPVIMVERPAKAGRHIVPTVNAALSWLDARHGKLRSERGV